MLYQSFNKMNTSMDSDSVMAQSPTNTNKKLNVIIPQTPSHHDMDLLRNSTELDFIDDKIPPRT